MRKIFKYFVIFSSLLVHGAAFANEFTAYKCEPTDANPNWYAIELHLSKNGDDIRARIGDQPWQTYDIPYRLEFGQPVMGLLYLSAVESIIGLTLFPDKHLIFSQITKEPHYAFMAHFKCR